MVHVVHAIIKEVRPVLLIFDVFRYISSNHVPLQTWNHKRSAGNQSPAISHPSEH